jgi:hypothetical protein
MLEAGHDASQYRKDRHGSAAADSPRDVMKILVIASERLAVDQKRLQWAQQPFGTA